MVWSSPTTGLISPGGLDGAAAAAAALAWVPITAADFVSTTPFKDPSSIVTNPLVIHATNGDITFDTTETGGITDGMGDGATWRLNWPGAGHAAGEFLGIGTQMLLIRMTPQDHPGAVSPTVGLGASDRDGDCTNVSAECLAIAVKCASATLFQGANVTRNAVFISSGTSVIGDAPKVIGMILPAGKSGDEAQVGLPGGRFGSVAHVHQKTTVESTIAAGCTTQNSLLSGGYYPILYAGWTTSGAENSVWKVKFEWALAEMFPIGEFP